MSDTPHANESQATPPYALHSLQGVVAATFISSFVGAGVVMAINFWRVGRYAAARNAVIAGILATIAVLFISGAVPDEFHGAVRYVGIPLTLWGAYAVADYFQRELISAHSAAGREIASAWWSAGIGCLTLPITIILLGAVIAVYVFLLPDLTFGNRVTFGNDEIYYSGEASKQDAQKLGKALTDLGYFQGRGASVRVEAMGGTYMVSFVVNEGVWNDAEMVDGFKDVAQELVPQPFPAPLTIQLCDDQFRAMKTLTIE